MAEDTTTTPSWSNGGRFLRHALPRLAWVVPVMIVLLVVRMATQSPSHGNIISGVTFLVCTAAWVQMTFLLIPYIEPGRRRVICAMFLVAAGVFALPGIGLIVLALYVSLG